MIFEEKKIDSCRIYEGAILNVRKDTVTAVKGQAYREIIEHNGAVAIVPVTAEGRVVMVKQYRYACGRTVPGDPCRKDRQRRRRSGQCSSAGTAGRDRI